MVLSNGHRWCLLVPEPWAMPMDWERAEAQADKGAESHAHPQAARSSGLWAAEINCELALHAASQRHIIYADSR